MVLRFFLFAAVFLLIFCSVPERDNPDDGRSLYYIESSSSSETLSSSSYVVQRSSSLHLSSSSLPPSSSSSHLSSSSLHPSSSSSNLCVGFVNGTKREHYGKEKEQFCDPRDGKKYVYVTIGTQTWMAENLNYNASGSECSNVMGNTTTCDTYGRFYNWATANTACPSGWHLPSNADWNVLMKFVNPSCTDDSNCEGAGTKLKADSPLWYEKGKGTDDFGFAALPGGGGAPNSYYSSVSIFGSWWGAGEDSSGKANSRYMSFNLEDVYYYHYEDKRFLYSVRCLQD